VIWTKHVTVNRNILLSKLEFYGITGRANNLRKSYLNDRYHRVLIKNKYSKNCFSEWEKVKQGVPQDSILGPLFFLLYINDLPGIINDISKPTIFADDTNIIFTHSNLTDFKDEINIVIEKINKWFQTSSLILNFNKTHYMQFMAKPKLAVDIHIGYKVVIVIVIVIYLAFHKIHTDIEAVINKINSCIAFFQ
jgi:hypothetical protein